MSWARSAEKRLVVLLALVALHSAGVGLGLLLLPRAYFGFFGFSDLGEPFFVAQGGVFHFVMALAYGLAARDPAGRGSLIVLSIAAKAVGTVFLAAWLVFGSSAWAVAVSAVGDFFMGLAIYVCWWDWRRTR